MDSSREQQTRQSGSLQSYGQYYSRAAELVPPRPLSDMPEDQATIYPDPSLRTDRFDGVPWERRIRIEADDENEGKTNPIHIGSHFKHMTISRDQTQANSSLMQQLAELMESKHELQQRRSETEGSSDIFESGDLTPLIRIKKTSGLRSSSPDNIFAEKLRGQESTLWRRKDYPESRPTKTSLAVSPRDYQSQDKNDLEGSRRSSISDLQDLSESSSRLNRSIDGRKVSTQQVDIGEAEDRATPTRNDSEIDYSIVKKLTDRIRALEAENHKLTTQGEAKPLRKPTWSTFYRLDGNIYIYEPAYAKDEQENIYLKGTSLVKDIGRYLDRHPEICFIIYKDYVSNISTDILRFGSIDEGVFQEPIPIKQSLKLESKDIMEAVKEFIKGVPHFPRLFPNFELYNEIEAPYLFIYFTTPMVAEILPRLKHAHQTLINLLFRCVLESHGNEYKQARQDFERGLVSKITMPYLIYPGEVLIDRKEKHVNAYMAESWGYESFPLISRLPRRRLHSSEDSFMGIQYVEDEEEDKNIWEVSCWSWDFNGAFAKKDKTQTINFATANETEKVEIVSLDLYPFRYADNETKELLRKRGRTFWRCRSKNFVSYQAEKDDNLNTTGERFMIDIATYKMLHPESAKSREPVHDDIGPETMACEEPPNNDTLLLFPSTITGYNMRLKKWVDLEVDRISDIVWNTQAFESLVVDDDMKELIQALITNQLASEKSTDLITGKGNGLIILLHGGPGTGKTFTAESVAEIAKKPLYRVTCGDIGTKPEDVEKYLESVLYLGKIWGCIVLLDEADVFLEERTLADLQRNALVSVFLRVLEYYEGILILTSNRVGTFDEAFKSRIQLALRYENLTLVQRRQIWRNFMNRLKAIGETRIDYEGICDHIDELAQEEMNGRQIRNAVTTARQLAQYKGKDFSYVHLRHVIKVAGKFDDYLKGVKEGFTDDQLARDGGLR